MPLTLAHATLALVTRLTETAACEETPNAGSICTACDNDIDKGKACKHGYCPHILCPACADTADQPAFIDTTEIVAKDADKPSEPPKEVKLDMPKPDKSETLAGRTLKQLQASNPAPVRKPVAEAVRMDDFDGDEHDVLMDALEMYIDAVESAPDSKHPEESVLTPEEKIEIARALMRRLG